MAVPQDWMPPDMPDAQKDEIAARHPNDPEAAAAEAWIIWANEMPVDQAIQVTTGSQSVTYDQSAYDASMERLGGKLDFILHSIGMSINVRKKKAYTDTKYDWMQNTFDISAISFHKFMQVAYQKDMMNDWGSILGLSYIAAQRTFPDYGEIAESKALLESFARSFGYHWAKKNNVRVNTVSQSPTMTTAGSGVKGFQEFFDYSDKMSPLGNASADSCADFCISLFSDLSKMVTMQNLYHDGGFSNMGMAPEVLE